MFGYIRVAHPITVEYCVDKKEWPFSLNNGVVRLVLMKVSFALNRLPHKFFYDMAVYLRREKK